MVDCDLAELDLSKNPNIERLDLRLNRLASLDISAANKLRDFFVEGDWIYNLMGRINFDDYESLNYFQRVLQDSGIFEMLEAKGCQDGDTVSIYEFEFDYVK